MAKIELEKIVKRYERSDAEAVSGVSLQIEDGEFVVLVGPSGCGKTTVLRMIAGLEEITDGELRIGGEVVNHVQPRDRDIAMVFQNYALFPHMSVYDNIAFGLQLSKVPKAEIASRVQETARIVDLERFLRRKPRQLSGGQRQRVAMGRAIIRRPKAFLMDEPLSNLDAKLRIQMRAEIARLQSDLSVTTVYVTHDQVEAMTMGDRVAVMRGGELQQVGTPLELFEHPSNAFVAGFIGSPAMNLVRAELARDGDGGGARVRLGSHALAVSPATLQSHPGLAEHSGGEVILGIRPQAFEVAALAADDSAPRMRVTATLAEVLGTDTLVRFDVDAPPVLTDELKELAADAGVDMLDRLEASATAGVTEFVARVDPRATVRPGESLELTIDADQLHYFDPHSGVAL
jgi:multiple sugar transport system ATP-binding protein